MTKHGEWKAKVSELIQTCQDEIKKTTEIGKKMISATRTNTVLNESYEELGRLAAKALLNQSLKWEDPEVESLINKIQSCQGDLEKIEGDVINIKISGMKKTEAHKGNVSKRKKDSSKI